MADNRRRYRVIWDGLRRLYPERGKGGIAWRPNVLAALISGIEGCQSANLPAIAGKLPMRKAVRW